MVNLLHNPVWEYVAGLVGGPLLIIFLFREGLRTASPLLRKAVWSAGSCVVIWSASGLIYHYGYYHLNPGLRMRVFQIKQLSAGGALALLFLLLSSAEFWRMSCARYLRKKSLA